MTENSPNSADESTLDQIRKSLIGKLKETNEFRASELSEIDELLQRDSFKPEDVALIFTKKEDENS